MRQSSHHARSIQQKCSKIIRASSNSSGQFGDNRLRTRSARRIQYGIQDPPHTRALLCCCAYGVPSIMYLVQNEGVTCHHISSNIEGQVNSKHASARAQKNTEEKNVTNENGSCCGRLIGARRWPGLPSHALKSVYSKTSAQRRRNVPQL